MKMITFFSVIGFGECIFLFQTEECNQYVVLIVNSDGLINKIEMT